jgi:DNA-binding transcriptional ArsR family regulator
MSSPNTLVTSGDSLNRTFAALADPVRRAILGRLALGEAHVSELAAPFGISMPAISRHLKVLQEAGLIDRRADAQMRLCRLNAQGLQMAADWLQPYREFWEEALDRLVDVLEATATTPDQAQAVAQLDRLRPISFVNRPTEGSP